MHTLTERTLEAGQRPAPPARQSGSAPPHRRAVAPYILLFVFAAYATSTLFWVYFNRVPPSWDPSDHFTASYDYYRLMAAGAWGVMVKDVLFAPHYYPPIFHLGTATFFLLFGPGPAQAISLNFMALAVLLFSTYKIGLTLYGRRAGCVAATLAASYHLPAALLHEGFLDYLLLAEVSLSMWLLLRAWGFTDRRRALLFGLSLALGMLTKQTFALSLLLPALGAGASVLASRNRQALVNLLLSGALALAVTAVWYWPHRADVREIYQINQHGATQEGEPPPLSLPSLTAYAFILGREQVQLPLALAFLAGLGYSLWRHHRASRLLYLWLAGGYLCFTMLANKDPRYTLPCLPAVALLSASLLAGGRARWRPVAAGLLVALGVASFVNAQWPKGGRGFYREQFVKALDLNTSVHVFDRNLLNYDHRPAPDDWSHNAVARLIADNIAGGTAPGGIAGEPVYVGVTLNRQFFNPSNLNWSFRLLDAKRPLPRVQVLSIFGETQWPSLSLCEFLVTSAERGAASFPLAEELRGEVVHEHGTFRQLGEVALPDGARVGVYQRVNPQTEGRRQG